MFVFEESLDFKRDTDFLGRGVEIGKGEVELFIKSKLEFLECDLDEDFEEDFDCFLVL